MFPAVIAVKILRMSRISFAESPSTRTMSGSFSPAIGPGEKPIKIASRKFRKLYLANAGGGCIPVGLFDPCLDTVQLCSAMKTLLSTFLSRTFFSVIAINRLRHGMARQAVLAAAAALFLGVAQTYAGIGASLQMQLGSASGATADPNNHAHYLIQRDQYALDYSDANGEPNWVSWDLTSGDIGSSGRSSFLTDSTLPVGFYRVKTTDYTNSGYDRGHMCPSADRSITDADNAIVFYMSNVMPQTPDNNQGVWESFEYYCRSLANAGDEALITDAGSGYTGAFIPSGKAAIPAYTWKIVVDVPAGGGTAPRRLTSSTRALPGKGPNISCIP